MYRSTKIKDGFSTCFRQWSADGTHCRFLHGYGTSIKIVFEGNLDSRNWVVDFGGFKRAKETINGMNPDTWLKWLLDHTTIIAEDDPELELFKELNDKGIIQLRILPHVGAERFAEFIFHKIQDWVCREYPGRVLKLVSVEFKEHEKNSAIYYEYN